MAMTRAEFDEKWHPVDVGLWAFYSADLDALLVAERERCAKVADMYDSQVFDLEPARFIASAIRALDAPREEK